MAHHWIWGFRYWTETGKRAHALKGVEGFHRSFYIYSGVYDQSRLNDPSIRRTASTMGGNAWRDLGNGLFTTVINSPYNHTKFEQYRFTDLELYALGLLPFNDVQDSLFFIKNPHNCKRDGKWYEPQNGEPTCPSKENYPQVISGTKFVEFSVSGTRVDVKKQQILDAEGPRGIDPSPFAPELPVAFVLLVSGNDKVTDEERDVMTRIVHVAGEAWQTVTVGRGSLENRSQLACKPHS